MGDRAEVRPSVFFKAKGTLLALRLFFGFLFIYASLDKIFDPALFADVIDNYQVVPCGFVNLVAVILPWLELILGLFLILGRWLLGAAFLTNLLLVVFWAAIVFNYLRGLDITCGCFTLSAPGDDAPSMNWYVIRDSFFLLMSLLLSYSTLLRTRQ